MKQIVMAGPKTSKIVDVPDVRPDDNQILIKIKYVGVCMSEHYDWEHAKEGQAFGHEPMGYVVEVGKNVEGFKVGDRVSGLWGSTLPGGGGMVEYAVANPKTSTVVKIPDEIRDEDAVLEPLACIVSAVSKVNVGMPGDDVCVVGCGYMGCGAIALLKARGARVIAVDIREESRRNALKYGAAEAYSPEEALAKFNPPITSPADFGKPRGFATVCEWGETEDSLDVAINLTRMCGRLYIGAYHTGGKRAVDVQQLNFKDIEMRSTHPRQPNLSDIGARNTVKMFVDGTWNYKNLPVKIYPMSKFDLAHEEITSKYGKYMKALIDMEKLDGEPIIK